MSLLRAPQGVTLATGAAQEIYKNTSTTHREEVSIRFSNIDGLVSANITVCNFLDANPNSVNPMLPVNAVVKVADAIEVTKILDPGDSIVAAASANGDIFALPEVVLGSRSNAGRLEAQFPQIE